jgi:hypothetical protein
MAGYATKDHPQVVANRASSHQIKGLPKVDNQIVDFLRITAKNGVLLQELINRNPVIGHQGVITSLLTYQNLPNSSDTLKRSVT